MHKSGLVMSVSEEADLFTTIMKPFKILFHFDKVQFF